MCHWSVLLQEATDLQWKRCPFQEARRADGGGAGPSELRRDVLVELAVGPRGCVAPRETQMCYVLNGPRQRALLAVKG